MNRILIDLTILTDDEQKKAGYGIKREFYSLGIDK